MSPRFVTVVALLVLLPAAIDLQDPVELPKPPQDPEKKRLLPPVAESYASRLERRDLLQQFGAPSPLEGVYHLVSFRAGGAFPIPATGYLSIGRRHLSLQLLSSRGRRKPAMQSTFRRYRISNDTLVMTTLVGFESGADDNVHTERRGASVVRRFQLVGTKLTLYGQGGRVMEFERIE